MRGANGSQGCDSGGCPGKSCGRRPLRILRQGTALVSQFEREFLVGISFFGLSFCKSLCALLRIYLRFQEGGVVRGNDPPPLVESRQNRIGSQHALGGFFPSDRTIVGAIPCGGNKRAPALERTA